MCFIKHSRISDGDFLLQIILRTTILYFIIILAIRLMGKRQIGDLQPSELVITILISEIAAMPLQDLDMPITNGVVATMTLVVLELIISVFAMKSIRFRKLFYGNSCIIIKDGVIDQKMLRRLRVTVPDLMEVLRNQEVFDINQVAYAILETNGQLSVLLKPPYQTASVNDLKGNPQPDGMPCLIVSDGKILTNAMKSVYLDKKDVQKIVKQNNLQLKDVFIMTASKNGDYSIVKKEK